MGSEGAKELVGAARELRAAGDAEGCLAAATSALQHNSSSWPAVACQCWALLTLQREREALAPLRAAVAAAKQPAVLQDLRQLLRQVRRASLVVLSLAFPHIED